jgi:SAM-dependent methyltransferase
MKAPAAAMDRALFERMAQVQEEHWWYRARREAIQEVVDALPAVPGGPALDFGCGSGANFEALARRGPVWGVDESLAAIDVAGRKGYERLICAPSPESPTMPPGPFALIGAFDVLEHIDDDAGAARELAKRLAPGGHLIVTVPCHPSLWSLHDECLGHRRRYTAASLHSLLEGSGFAQISSCHLFSMLMPLAWAQRLLMRARPAAAYDPVAIPAVNEMLYALARVDKAMRVGRLLPFGLSLLAVARTRESAR